MAVCKNNILGRVSGKLGNLILRRRYGKDIIYSKPDAYNISYSDKAIAGRAKFANTVKLARLINSNLELSSIWKRAELKGTNSYQKIIKLNSRFTTVEGLSLKNLITPPGIAASSVLLEFERSGISVRLECSIKSTSLKATLYILLCPISEGKSPNLSLLISWDTLINEQFIKGTAFYSPLIKSYLKDSLKIIFLTTFVFTKSDEELIDWTTTSSFEITNP
ncbi:MAG: hypothetical protein Q8L04_18310 [Ignavibacteria bacterium]|nr:hypothetical protein [Ignavibacteria bacterium]